MRRLDLQRKNLNDRHNTLDEQTDTNDVEKLLNSSLKYTPESYQTWQQYVAELQTHIKYADDKNRRTHIEGKRPWYTHRSPLGCFMCEDIALRHVMLRVLQLMANAYPDTKFNTDTS